jgi:hypothetical protein
MRKSIAGAIAAAGLSLSAFVGGFASSPRVLAESPEREAAEICGQAEALGTLSDSSRTRADCVDAIIGPRDEETLAYIARLCSAQKIQEKMGVTDSRDCVQRVQAIVSVEPGGFVHY